MADAYAKACQEKTAQAISAGKMKDMIIPIDLTPAAGTKMTADSDQHPRPGTTMEGLAGLKTPFKAKALLSPCVSGAIF